MWFLFPKLLQQNCKQTAALDVFVSYKFPSLELRVPNLFQRYNVAVHNMSSMRTRFSIVSAEELE